MIDIKRSDYKLPLLQWKHKDPANGAICLTKVFGKPDTLKNGEYGGYVVFRECLKKSDGKLNMPNAFEKFRSVAVLDKKENFVMANLPYFNNTRSIDMLPVNIKGNIHNIKKDSITFQGNSIEEILFAVDKFLDNEISFFNNVFYDNNLTFKDFLQKNSGNLRKMISDFYYIGVNLGKKIMRVKDYIVSGNGFEKSKDTVSYPKIEDVTKQEVGEFINKEDWIKKEDDLRKQNKELMKVKYKKYGIDEARFIKKKPGYVDYRYEFRHDTGYILSDEYIEVLQEPYGEYWVVDNYYKMKNTFAEVIGVPDIEKKNYIKYRTKSLKKTPLKFFDTIKVSKLPFKQKNGDLNLFVKAIGFIENINNYKLSMIMKLFKYKVSIDKSKGTIIIHSNSWNFLLIYFCCLNIAFKNATFRYINKFYKKMKHNCMDFGKENQNIIGKINEIFNNV